MLSHLLGAILGHRHSFPSLQAHRQEHGKKFDKLIDNMTD
jgi:hypothetical protein